MDDHATPIETLLERAEDYGKTTLELFKLNAIEKSADVASSFISHLLLYITVALSFLIVNIGLALWVGKLLGDSFYGFFVLGGLYALLAIPLHLFREQWIKYPISNSIIRELLKQKALK